MEDPAEEARRARLAASHRRGRWILLGLALGLPLGLHALFERQARPLDALADHGRSTLATVTLIEGGERDGNTSYEYRVDGARYTWSVRASQAPARGGETFAIRYLPEDPALSRPGADPSAALREANANRKLAHDIELGILVFFLINVGMLELKIRKLRQRERWVISPRSAGWLFGSAMIGCVVLADLAPEVRAVYLQAFGERLAGFPSVPLVMTVQVLLLLPYLWVSEHLLRIVFQALADGASSSPAGLLSYIWDARRVHPELVRSRRIVLAGFAYLLVLMGAWIAYAEARGL